MKTRFFGTLLLLFALLVPCLLKAQDYSGVYYIKSNTSAYYLVPAANPQQADGSDAYFSGDTDKSFLTTYQTGEVDNAIWQIEKTTDDYYYIIHSLSGSYVVYEPVLTGGNARRKCMHLLVTNAPPENAKFTLTSSGSYYVIQPKNPQSATDVYWNVASGNQNQYYGTGSSPYYGGLVGLYNDANDANSKWTFVVADAAAIPVITADAVNQQVIITSLNADATIYYTLDGSEPSAASTVYSGPVTIGNARVTVRAIAYRTVDGVQKISNISTALVDFRVETEITLLSQITNLDGLYKLTVDIADAGAGIGGTFTGALDGDGHRIAGLTSPLFAVVRDATVRNIVFDQVEIEQSGKVGAVCGTALGASAIYNVGLLGGSVKSTDDYCGGLVGLLDGRSRVVNCYSYASVEGTNAGGIVGYNNYASTSGDLRTMVMNCMMYGNVTGSVTASPVYGGELISNRRVNNTDNKGLNNYNYFSFGSVEIVGTPVYNGTLGAEERYLQRWEFYRHILNSTRALASFYATGDAANEGQMYKWVRLPDSIGTRHPYPVLAAAGTYPSVVNPDADAAPVGAPRNQGGKLGSLTVNIQMGSGGAHYGAPTGAAITQSSLTLTVTDKDTARYNFNYRKVQLPYYNQVGTGNCTGNRVVTGWKIVSVAGGTQGTFSTNSYDWPSFNFADRASYAKDLYSQSGRVFSQGAYFDVPDDVTAITIEPYWAYCTYLSDPYYDVTYGFDESTHGYNNATANVLAGQRYANNNSYLLNGSSQVVYTVFTDARSNCNMNASHTVYDHAIVLVGNYHSLAGQNSPFGSASEFLFTVMSADFDNDNEPDYCVFNQFTQRVDVSQIRFDFVTVAGIGIAHKIAGSLSMPQNGIYRPSGWFEVTNTCLIQFGQFEYDMSGKSLAPLILQGGIYDQFVSTNDSRNDGGMGAANASHTQYIHLGGNAWFRMFNNGVHGDLAMHTPKRPVSVTGGEYEEFYLSGMFNASAATTAFSSSADDQNAECYIDGGRFGELAGSGMEQIDGDVTWKIVNADIVAFYGGGINAAKEVTGNISTTIKDSYVQSFYGGPKFGDMYAGKTVVTNADGCTFGSFFGAGYGGTSFNRVRTRNLTELTNYDFNGWRLSDYSRQYKADKGGTATKFEYELIHLSGGSNKNNVGRFYVCYAMLSLATTNNVTSTLTGCTVENDFHGGGQLGTVSGDINSVLTDCNVLGNAFGAGFSAQAPTVDVMPKSDFVVEPYYNGEIGVFVPGVYPEAVTYTWKQAATVSTGSEFDETDGHFILTASDLSNLGKVLGNTHITVGGSSTVGGSVFGGGDAAEVVGDTQVKILNRALIYGNVYGGGNMGRVGGNTNVVIDGD